jgi:hypothetical protein
MKVDVANVYSGREWHAKRLDSAIEVFIVKRILVVPDSGGRIGHFVAHEPNTVVTRIRFKLVYYGTSACPSHDGWLHPHRGTNRGEAERRWSTANGKLPIGDVIIHVALPGMGLAP